MNAKERILQYLEYKSIRKSKFYKDVGLSNGFLDKVKDIGSGKLELILKSYPDINPEWLLTGKGNMLKKAGSGADEVASADKMTENLQYIIELQKEKIARLEEELAEAQRMNRKTAATD